MAATETGTSLAQRTQQVVDAIQNPIYLEQIRELLPENVTLDRFKRVAITAVRANPDLVSADQNSLFSALLRCAQDGLMPDGREAALPIYGKKVGYLRMIGGIQKIAAEYGWALRTSVVYANDEFDYAEEPPMLTHRPVRPGMDRGDLFAAYAVATHRDGRRVQIVLPPEDVAKRRAKAQSQNIWNEWPEAMWSKSAGHALFKKLPLDPNDARIDRLLREGVFADPIAALWRGATPGEAEVPPTEIVPPDDGANVFTESQPGSGELSPAAACADTDEEEAIWTVAPTEAEVEAAGAIVVPKGLYKDKTLADVASEADGAAWFLTQLKSAALAGPTRASFETFVMGALPETWTAYEAWKEQS